MKESLLLSKSESIRQDTLKQIENVNVREV